MTKKHMVSVAVLVATIGIIAFYGGIQYANAAKGGSANSQFQGGQGQRNRQGGRQFGNGQAGSFASGEILSVDAQSVTVKLANGGSKIAFYSASTKISKTVDGTIEDLKIGENLMVNGQDNPDGSMTAQSIQLRNRPLVDPNAKTTPQPVKPNATR